MDKETKQQKDTKLPYESAEKFCQNQLQTWKKIAELQLEFARLWQDYCNASVQRLSDARDVSDLYAIEAGLSTEYGSKFAEYSRKAFEVISDSQQDMMECFATPEKLFRSMFTNYPDFWKNFPGLEKQAGKDTGS